MSKRGALFLFAWLAMFTASPAFAYSPTSDAPPIEHTCIDRDELAGVLTVEGGNQPTADVIRMGQIILAEVRDPHSTHYGLTICALTRLTDFVSVRHYARAHPESWTARNIDNPSEWIVMLAGDLLTDKYPDVRAGAGHWNGSLDGQHIEFSN